jgi:hypothetical protein
MSEFQQEEPDSGEEFSEEDARNPPHEDVNGDLWETNDEAAQGEQGQDSV